MEHSYSKKDWFLPKIIILLFLIPSFCFGGSFNDYILIGGNGPADSKAQLDVRSTSRGVLLPRMSTTQQNAISSPTEGLIVYDNVLHQLSIFDGTSWQQMFDAGNLTGTIPPGTVPTATTGALGIVFAKNATSHNFITGITSGTGAITSAQPACGDLSNSAASCSTDATNASNISSGTLNTARLPTPMLVGNGSVSAPAYSFTNSTGSGAYYIGTNHWGLAVGGSQAADFNISSPGALGNVGLGGSASVSDYYPLLILRTIAGTIQTQMSNGDTGAGSGSKFQILSDGGNNDMEISSFTAATVAPDIYAGGRGVVRAAGSLAGLTLMADNGASADVRIYAGDGITDRIATANSSGFTLGVAGSLTGKLNIAGATSGTVTIQPQSAAGTYNFNLPTTAGAAGTVLTSQGGGSTAMTWSTPTGTITGPGSSTNTAFARWSGTGGTALQDSVFTGASTGILTTTGDTSGLTMTSVTDTTASGSIGVDHTSTSLLIRTLESSTNPGYTLGLSTANIAGSNANQTGAISLTTGNKTAGTGNSGDISAITGTSAGGTRGRINLKDGSDGYAGLVWTSVNNSGGGHWMKPTSDINFIANPDAELNNAVWATYTNTAQATPVSGTGGAAATVTWTQTTSSPLAGVGSFLFTKDAVNRQGQGASYDFTIRSADQAKVMQVEFDYAVASGTFVAGSSGVDSDIEVYLYDITNSVLIQPSTYKLFSSATSPPSHFTANFQTASNSTSYRLIFHTATASALAYTVKFDSVTVSPSRYVYGTPITDTVPFTPVLSASTTPPTLGVGSFQQGSYRKTGDVLEVWEEIGFGASGTNAGSGTYRLTLPNNYTIDTVKMTQATARAYGGTASIQSAGTTTDGIAVEISGTNPGFVVLTKANTPVTNVSPGAWTAGDYIKAHFTVPIVGWSSTVQMSDSAPQTLIAMNGLVQTPTGTLTSSYNVIKFGTATSDSSGAYSTSTGLYTCPTQGKYRVYGNVEILGTYTAGQSTVVKIFKNGTSGTGVSLGGFNAVNAVTSTQSIPFQGSVDCNAGDTLGVYASSVASTLSYTQTLTGSSLFIEKLSDPRTIGATETVGARYFASATAPGTVGSPTTITYTTKDYDTHSAYSSGTYTIPVAGKYAINACALQTAATTAANELAAINIAKNGSAVTGTEIYITSTTSKPISTCVSDIISFAAGDTMTITAGNAGTTPSMSASNSLNYFSIVREGM